MDIKVAIFEDNAKFLDALSILIDGLPGFILTCARPDTANIIELLKRNTPDIVLMDIEIAPLDGIDATKLILQHFPSVRILIQTVFEDDDKVFAAICSGASGYVLKSYLPTSLEAAMLEVAKGGAPISPSIAGKILNLFKLHVPGAALHEDYRLSKREKEILKYLVEGASYKMIADKCSISFETVKTHIKRIYEKLHVASMTEAVAKAIHERLT
jgi:DNA-binding NarL/FixJ family response regulator